MRNRLLVVGEGTFAKELASAGAGVLHPELDYESVLKLLGLYEPDVIILTPQWVESLPQHPFHNIVQIGADFAIHAGKIALAARAANALFVLISNVSVFVGGWAPARDTEEPNPVSEYGVTVWWMENAVRRLNRHTKTVRIPHLVGNGRDGWPARVIENDLDKTKGKEPFVAVPDLGLVSPTCSHCAANVIVRHVRLDPDLPRVVHVGPVDGPISWYDFSGFVGPVKRGSKDNVFGPRQMGLVPTEGWETGTLYKQATHLLLGYSEYVLPPSNTGT